MLDAVSGPAPIDIVELVANRKRGVCSGLHDAMTFDFLRVTTKDIPVGRAISIAENMTRHTSCSLAEDTCHLPRVETVNANSARLPERGEEGLEVDGDRLCRRKETFRG